MRKLLALTLVLTPWPLQAQEGAILFDRSVRYDFELPERMDADARAQIPSRSITTMLLFFNESETLMVPAPDQEEEEGPRPAESSGRIRRAELGGYVGRLRMASTSRSDQEVLLEAFLSLEDGSLTETREFMTRKFLIAGPCPEFSWKLTGEQSRFLDYPVYKATAVQDSSTLEAWFTPAIPVSGGPGPYGGLPGMILSLSIDDGHTVYSATEVNLRPVDEGVIRPPEEGQEVTREEYEEMVVEKLQELEMRNQGRRRRGGNAVGRSQR